MALTKVTYSMIEGAPVNVLDYGADPTGVADSTSAIQAAVDTGNPVVFPYGSYKFLNVTATSGSIQIDGQGSTFLTIPNANTTSQNFFEFTGCDSVVLKNFICDGGFGTSTAIVSGAANDDDAITCDTCTVVNITGVTVTGWSSGSTVTHDSAAIFTKDCGDVTVQSCSLSYVSKEGFLDNGSGKVRYMDNLATQVGYSPFGFADVSGVLVSRNRTITTGVNAAGVSLVSGLRCNDVQIDSNFFQEHGQAFTTPYDSSYGAPGVVPQPDTTATALSNWQVTNNVFDKMRYAFYDSNVTSAKTEFMFSGNRVSRCYEGVSGFTATTGFVISANTFRLCRRCILIADSTGSQYIIDGNLFREIQNVPVKYTGDSTGAVSSQLVVQNNSAVSFGTTISGAGYELTELGDSVIQNNIAITGSGTVSSHFIISDRLPIVTIQNNTARGASSSEPFDFSGNSAANRLMRFNVGYGRNLLGTSQPADGDTWEETTATGQVLSFGAYRLWVDATGDLRIVSGAPASDTDGTVVGTQS